MDLYNNPFISTNSSDVIILWKNNVPLSNDKVSDDSFYIHQQLNETCSKYKIPHGLDENYIYFLNKTAEDLVKNVIAESESVFQCSLKTYKLNVSKTDHEHEYKVTNKKYIKICRDKLLRISDSNQSLTSESRWLIDQEALVNISEYIRQDWDLDKKFLFTIEKTDTTITCGSTCHKYKVEFSVPTPEYPIPQITVSVFFTVETTPYLSLPTYVKYQFEMDRRAYVMGKHSFNKKRFEHLFEIKRDVYADINKYSGWSSGPSGCSRGINS